MAIKRIEAIYKFLQAARNLVKNKDMSKENILRFAKQEFGEVSQFLRKQIDDIFKTKPKTQKKGEVVPIKKQEGIVRRPEEFATRKEYERYLDETLGPPDDVFGSPMKDDLLKEWDKVKAKNVTPKVDRLKFIPGGSRYAEGNLRTAIRQFLRTEEKAGRIKLNKTDSFRVREYSPMKEDDPIDVFRRYYGEDALDAADAMADELRFGESFSHYEEIFRKNMPDLKVKVKGAGEYDDSVKAGEELRKLSEFDPSGRKPNAEGGLIDILKI